MDKTSGGGGGGLRGGATEGSTGCARRQDTRWTNLRYPNPERGTHGSPAIQSLSVIVKVPDPNSGISAVIVTVPGNVISKRSLHRLRWQEPSSMNLHSISVVMLVASDLQVRRKIQVFVVSSAAAASTGCPDNALMLSTRPSGDTVTANLTAPESRASWASLGYSLDLICAGSQALSSMDIAAVLQPTRNNTAQTAFILVLCIYIPFAVIVMLTILATAQALSTSTKNPSPS